MKNTTHFNFLHSDTTEIILNVVWEVYNYYGGSRGFTESIYEAALEIELLSRGLQVERQCPIKVYYKGYLVGNFKADLIVNDVIIELKAVSCFHEMHEVQLVNYLRATEIEVGLLLNFGDTEKLGIKRKVFSNSRKKTLNRIP